MRTLYTKTGVKSVYECKDAGNVRIKYVKYYYIQAFFYHLLLTISRKAIPLHRVFHSIRFKVNKGWGKALPLFLCPYITYDLLQKTHTAENNKP